MPFGPLPPRTLATQDIGAVLENIERFQYQAAGGQDWARKAVTCIEFFEGKQWTEKQKQELEEQGRPALTINKISPLVRVALGYERANRHDIKYNPGSDGASTSEIAGSLTHTVKQIMDANRAPWLFSEVFRDGITAARGYIDVRLSFQENLLGEIALEVLDPFTVYPDPEASTYEPSGWADVTVTKWLSLNDIELTYGKTASEEIEGAALAGGMTAAGSLMSTEADLSDDITPERFFGLWKHLADKADTSSMRIGPFATSLFEHVDRNRKLIRVLDRQHNRLAKVRHFVDMQTGQMKEIPPEWKRERIQRVLAWAQGMGQAVGIFERMEKKVRWTTTAADQLLYDDWSPYRSFTIIPYFGYFRRGKTMGLIDDLLDPQREINKRRSAETHIVGTTASSGWMYEDDAMSVESKATLRRFGQTPGVNIELRQGGLDKIKRIEPAAVAQNVERLEKKSTDDLKEISNMNVAILGQDDRVQSGRALEAKQRQAIIGLETYLDNMNRTRHLVGEKCKELIQDFYTETRLIRLIDEAGEQVDKIINLEDTTGAILNDVRVGKYTTTVESVPASQTFQAAQFEEVMDMVEKGVPVPVDVIVDMSSMPRKQEIKERILAQQQIEQAAVAAAAGALPAPAGDPGSLASRPLPTNHSSTTLNR